MLFPKVYFHWIEENKRFYGGKSFIFLIINRRRKSCLLMYIVQLHSLYSPPPLPPLSKIFFFYVNSCIGYPEARFRYLNIHYEHFWFSFGYPCLFLTNTESFIIDCAQNFLASDSIYTNNTLIGWILDTFLDNNY